MKRQGKTEEGICFSTLLMLFLSGRSGVDEEGTRIQEEFNILPKI